MIIREENDIIFTYLHLIPISVLIAISMWHICAEYFRIKLETEQAEDRKKTIWCLQLVSGIKSQKEAHKA